MKKKELFWKKAKKAAALFGAAFMLTAVMAGCGCAGTADQENQVQESAAVEETGYRDDVACADLQAAVAAEFGDNYWPNMDIPEEYLSETFGISADLYEEYVAQMPMISTNVDTLIIVKAKEGSEQAVEDAMNAYYKVNTENAMQYPMNLGKVQAAQIKTFGRYVGCVQLGADVMTQMEEGDAAVIAHCEQENARALDVIEGMLIK